MFDELAAMIARNAQPEQFGSRTYQVWYPKRDRHKHWVMDGEVINRSHDWTDFEREFRMARPVARGDFTVEVSGFG